jgi:hypothetical protein
MGPIILVALIAHHIPNLNTCIGPEEISMRDLSF